MKHLGDITKISGYTAPIVDAVIGGSPCQDLSIAGKRAGLDGERSGLFMEQLRIIKEMRECDKRTGRTDVDIRPRYMVWENVPGAFSSNKGEDFRIVLEETAKVADKDAVIPMPDKGKWANSGCIVGDGWSIAWRILDAQFWGTSDKPLPQRRRRIALVADFGGESAPEILFVRQSVSGDIEPGKPKGKETPCIAPGSIGADDREGENESVGLTNRGFVSGDTSETLRAESHGAIPMVATLVSSTLQDQTLFQPVYSFDQGDVRASEVVVALDRASFNQGKNAQFDMGISDNGIAQSMVAKGPGAVCYAVDHGGEPAVAYGIGAYHSNAWKSDNPYSGVYEADTAKTLDALTCGNPSCNQGGMAVVQNVAYVETSDGDIAGTLDASYYKGRGLRQGRERTFVAVAAVDCRNGTENADINGTLQSHPNGGASLNLNNVVRVRQGARYIVRRLTPLECERLQGYPDGWTLIGEPIEKVVEDFDEDTGEKEGEHIETEFYYTNSQGKRVKASDAARYKALGNSIALPPWKWVLKRLCACYERDATMASLFDGIGGFPYLWEQLNGKGSCLWASEIEEFPMAVTKVRLGE